VTADNALAGLRRLGLDYRPDVRHPDGLWGARCPACRVYCDPDARPLTIRENRRGGQVSFSCANGCSTASVVARLAVALMPESIEARLRRVELKVAAIERWAA
jgi:hypothetical protein